MFSQWRFLQHTAAEAEAMLQHWLSCAGSEILGKGQNSSSSASQKHELEETRLTVEISDCDDTK